MDALVDQGLRTISPENVQYLVEKIPLGVLSVLQKLKWQNNAFIAGGFLRQPFDGVPVSDLDIWVSQGAGYADMMRDELRRVFPRATVVETEFAYTFHGKGMKLPVQVIHRWRFNTPAEVVAHFDFTCCAAAMWLSGTGQWLAVADDAFAHDCMYQKLVYRVPKLAKAEDVAGSLLRMCKYLRKGYSMPPEDLAALIVRFNLAMIHEKKHPMKIMDVIDVLREVDPLPPVKTELVEEL